jgi:hypothetical protein
MPEELTKQEREELAKKLRNVKVPYDILEDDNNVFTEEERKELLASMKSIFAYTGCMIPQAITLDEGTTIRLKELVWDLMSKKDLPDEEVVAARQLADILNKRAEHNKVIIERYNLTDDEAEKLYFLTCGLLRAVMELRGLGNREREDEYARMARERRIDDAKKILAFFKSVKL